MGRSKAPGRRRAKIADAESEAGPWLKSKAAQLVEFLRRAIQLKRLTEPVPGSREWSRQLGVSRRVLTEAIQELQREGWLTIHQRGVRLHPERAARLARGASAPRVVRLLFFSAYRRHLHGYFETINKLQEQLRLRDIELKWETCTPSRLRGIARQPAAAHELLVLASLPPVFQRLFVESGKPACVLGEVAPGLSLPFVNVDQAGAVRHATFRLLQRGIREVALVHINVEAAGIRSAIVAMRTACAEWPRQPVTARMIATALDQSSLVTTVRRLAEGTGERRGFIVLAPVPVGMVVTALLHHGVAIPRQAEVVALFHWPEAVKLYPPPTHYPSPVGKLVKQLADVATRFFESGRVPAIRKTISVEVAKDS